MKKFTSPDEAEEIFRNNIELLGAKMVGIYINSSTKVKCICKNGHECNPTPSNVKKGAGICKKCAGLCPEDAAKNFKAKIEELGGKLIGEYKRSDLGVLCICKNGHEFYAVPDNVKQRNNICKKCAKKCPIEAEKRFRERIAELGGEVIGEYKTHKVPILCICKNGHENYLKPAQVISNGMCKKCSGQCTIQAGENFVKNIERLGGQVIGEYKGANTPVKCICQNGHECYPYPTSIQQHPNWIPCTLCLRKSEAVVLNLLSEFSETEREVRFEWCRNPKSDRILPFDFVLEKEKIIIEVDGIFHFKDLNFYYSEFEKIQTRDIFKMKMALNNGYKVIRIFQEDIAKLRSVNFLNFKMSWEAALVTAIRYAKCTDTNLIFLSSDTDIYTKYIESFNL